MIAKAGKLARLTRQRTSVSNGLNRAVAVRSKGRKTSPRPKHLRFSKSVETLRRKPETRKAESWSQRETKKQASPIVTTSSSRATKMSLMFNPATNFFRIS